MERHKIRTMARRKVVLVVPNGSGKKKWLNKLRKKRPLDLAGNFYRICTPDAIKVNKKFKVVHIVNDCITVEQARILLGAKRLPRGNAFGIRL